MKARKKEGAKAKAKRSKRRVYSQRHLAMDHSIASEAILYASQWNESAQLSVTAS